MHALQYAQYVQFAQYAQYAQSEAHVLANSVLELPISLCIANGIARRQVRCRHRRSHNSASNSSLGPHSETHSRPHTGGYCGHHCMRRSARSLGVGCVDQHVPWHGGHDGSAHLGKGAAAPALTRRHNCPAALVLAAGHKPALATVDGLPAAVAHALSATPLPDCKRTRGLASHIVCLAQPICDCTPTGTQNSVGCTRAHTAARLVCSYLGRRAYQSNQHEGKYGCIHDTGS